jgi:hypothetical protein
MTHRATVHIAKTFSAGGFVTCWLETPIVAAATGQR